MELNYFYKKIVKSYQTISKSINIILEHSYVNKSLNLKEPIFFTIVRHMDKAYFYNTLNDITIKNRYINFINKLNEKSGAEFREFMNKYGNELQRHVYTLIDENKIPSFLLGYIKDKSIYSEFTSIDIQYDIENNDYNVNQYKLTYNDMTINLKLVTQKKIAKEKLNKIAVRCFLFYDLLKINKNVTINLYLTKAKKIMPKYKILGSNEINSGVTIHYLDTIINLFRDEEVMKVLVHELIHCYNIDNRDIRIDFNQHFNIPYESNYYVSEAYTEFLAVIINTMLFSYENSKKYDYQLFLKYIEEEIEFSLLQNAKILLHYGFNHIDEFNRKNDNNLYQQSTNVFSYFFIKGALLYDYRKFFKLIQTLGSNLICKTENLDILKNNYLLYAKREPYLKNIQKYIRLIKHNKIKTSLLNTLKMTLK